jgi:hypothetical protein
MASVYTNDLRLEEIGSGEQSGTWGDTTNTNLELIAEAFSFGTEASFSSDANATTTLADGATDAIRSLYLKVTSGASLTATRELTIAPNTVSKVWIIENATSGSQSITIKQGSGATVTIPNGQVKMVYSDGAGSGAAVVDALVDLDLTGTTTIAAANISGDLDVDGTANLDVVDIDGAVDMASTLQVDGAITSSSGATITTADNNPQLTLISTDTDANVGPVLDLNRNVTGADDDNLGSITFTAKDDAGNAQTYAKIDTSIRDASNTSEASRLNFHVANNGSVTKFLGFIGQTASAGAEITFNEDSNDIDFRVESNGNANMINVDAGNDRVGIGMIPDTTALTVSGQIGTTNGSASAPTHSFYSDADTGMFRTAANIIGFATGGTERVQIGSFGVAADAITNKTASGGITIDAAGDITLDADGGDVIFKDGGSEKGRFTNNSGTFTIDADTNLTFKGDVQTFDSADGSTEYMRIDSNGNLGINGNPISYANGQAALFIEDTANPAIGISDTGQSKDYYIVANGSRLGIVYGDGSNSSSFSSTAEIASFNNNGRVGIGQDNPDTLLHISGAPDDKLITFDQSGRKSAIGTFFSSGSTNIIPWWHYCTSNKCRCFRVFWQYI